MQNTDIDIQENDSYFNPPGKGWEDFDADGDLVTVAGGPSRRYQRRFISLLNSDGAVAGDAPQPHHFVHSLLVMQPGAGVGPGPAYPLVLVGVQLLCAEPARNNQGGESDYPNDLISEAEEEDGTYPEAEGQFKNEINNALELLKKYNSALARCRELEERLPTFGVSRDSIQTLQAEWQEGMEVMGSCDWEVAFLSDEGATRLRQRQIHFLGGTHHCGGLEERGTGG